MGALRLCLARAASARAAARDAAAPSHAHRLGLLARRSYLLELALLVNVATVLEGDLEPVALRAAACISATARSRAVPTASTLGVPACALLGLRRHRT